MKTLLTLFCYTLFYFGLFSQAEIQHPSSNTILTASIDFQDGDIYTDSGGSVENYSVEERSTLTLCAPAGQSFSISFSSFITERDFDFLTITGSLSSDNMYSGNDSPGLVFSSEGGCVELDWISDLIFPDEGWVATFSIETTAPIPTLSQWGFITLLFSCLILGTIVLTNSTTNRCQFP
jgi:hypothetical protein